jgi:hypothetical protein
MCAPYTRKVLHFKFDRALCEDGDIGAFTSDLRSAFFANLANMATSAHAIASHITLPGGARE